MTVDPHAGEFRVDGRPVYAIGDVHGRFDLLKGLLALIAEDAADADDVTLVMLGDYVDRGPQSAAVLATLVWLRANSGWRLHFLKGNHEAMLLDFLDAPGETGAWVDYGGDALLASYGVEPPDSADADELAAARDALLDRMPASHLRLLQSLETRVEIGDHLFVHAGIRPGIALDRQRDEDLLWIREPFLSSTARLSKRVVHGHSWSGPEPEVAPFRIGVDTGAWRTGVLTAVRLDDGRSTFLKVREEPGISNRG